MLKRPFHLLWLLHCGLSLLLAIACLAVWLLTLHTPHIIDWTNTSLYHASLTLASTPSQFQLLYNNGTHPLYPYAHWRHLGTQFTLDSSGWTLSLPWYLPTLLFTLSPYSNYSSGSTENPTLMTIPPPNNPPSSKKVSGTLIHQARKNFHDSKGFLDGSGVSHLPRTRRHPRRFHPQLVV